MAVEKNAEFIEQLKQSKIASPEIIALWTRTLDLATAPEAMAKSLVASDYLTKWQARQILAGNARLRIGNHVLMDRLLKNDIGTQFLARQVILDRQVKLTFLNQTLSKRLQQRTELVRRVAQSADSNDRHLEHLHVIERDGDRFFLVTDFIDGKTLDDPTIDAKFEADCLPDLLISLCEGTHAIHRQGLTHGALSESDILVDSQNQLWIQNYTLSFLVHALSDEDLGYNTSPFADNRAVARIANRLVSRLENDQCKIDLYDSLFEQLASEKITLEQLANSLQQQIKRPRNMAANGTSERGNLEASNANTPAKKRLEPKSTEPKEPPIQPTSIPKSSWPIHVAIAATTLAVLLIAYSSGWLDGQQDRSDATVSQSGEERDLPKLPQLSQPEPLTQVATEKQLPNIDDDASDAQSLDRNFNEPRVTDKLIEPVADDSLEFPQTAGPGAETDITLEDPTVTDVATSPETIQQDITLAGDLSLLNKFKSIVGESSNSATGATATSNPATETNTQKQIDPPSSSGTSAAPVQPTPTDSVAEEEKETIPTTIPAAIDLPATDDASDFPIANLGVVERLNARLISDSNIAAQPLTFSMRGNRNNGWTISEDGVDLCRVGLTSGVLSFRWLDQAAEKTDAGYLANCVLRTEVDGKPHYIALRRPVIIDGLQLERKKPLIRRSLTELKFLPKQYFAQFVPNDQPELGELYFEGDTENHHFGRRNELEVHFSDLPEYRLFYLALAADLKKRQRIEASLKLQLDPRAKAKIADQKLIDSAKQFLQSTVTDIKQRHDYLKNTKIDDIRAQFNLSDKVYKNQDRNAQVKELKLQLELAEKRFAAFRETQTKIEPFFQRSIPISVYFLVDGQRVVLATTVVE